jgi:hypothetical protein
MKVLTGGGPSTLLYTQPRHNRNMLRTPPRRGNGDTVDPRAGGPRDIWARHPVLALPEGLKKVRADWTAFLRRLKERELKDVRLFVSGPRYDVTNEGAGF